MKLYGFFNSSTSFRTRIALELKGIAYDYVPVNLRAGGQREAEYRVLSPAGIVPTLIDGDVRLTQSLAIIHYLDQIRPEPRLLPAAPLDAAHALEIAYTIACDIHPINNLRVLRYLTAELGVTEDAKTAWYQHWVNEGLSAVNTLLTNAGSGRYCIGDAPTLADCCLIPQVANAMRMNCGVEQFEAVVRIYDHCMTLPAFINAAPSNQPDYVA